MCKVSIIVPCYNQGVYLEECINSLINQTYHDWECIIVDDGSTDDSASIIEKMTKMNERVRAVFQENNGVSAARNYAITKSKGVFILPLDADDKLSSNYIELCVKTLEEDSSIVLAYGSIKNFGILNSRLKPDLFSYEVLLRRNMIHCSGMYKKSDWEQIGGYDESMLIGLEDWEFWIHLLNSSSNVCFIRACTLFYRSKEKSRNNSFSLQTHEDIKRYIGTKHINVYYTQINNLPDFMESKEILSKEVEYLRYNNKIIKKISKRLKRTFKF
jgi:glycosyltransferase involved in cell wall biosynthesis